MRTVTRVSLPDGRKVQLEEYGDPAGTPTVWLHGAISSRLEAAFLDAPARELGVRVIAPDRPGVGGPDPLPGHSVTGYVSDVVDVLDALQLEQVVVGGHSNGGMYAMAVASLAPARVRRAVIANPSTPVADGAAREALSRTVRLAYALSARGADRIAARLDAKKGPGRLMEAVSRRVGPDARLFDDPANAAWLAANTAEALRQTGSPYFATELALASRPWGFDHRAVPVPVVLVSGHKDAGDRYARVWAGELPDGHLVTVPGGHAGIVAPATARRIAEALAGRPC